MKKIVYALVVTVILFGCSPTQDELSPKTENSTSEKIYFEKTGFKFDDLGLDDAVVKVNEKVLTKRDICKMTEMNIALRLHKKPDIASNQLSKIRVKAYKVYPNEFVKNVLLEQYAATNGIEVGEKTLKAFERRAFMVLRAKGDKSYDDLLKIEGIDSSLVDSRIRFEALEYEIKKKLKENKPLILDPGWADKKIKSFHDYNARVTLTNELVFARATNVWNQLKQGGEFKSLAAKYTEIPAERKDNGMWGELDNDFLKGDHALLAEIKKLKPGQFTPPVEGDNGLMIARLDGFTEDGLYILSRIFFQLPMFIEIPTKEELIESAHIEHVEKKYKDLLKILKENAIIEFPSGQKLFTKEAK